MEQDPSRFRPTLCRSCKASIRFVRGLEEGTWFPLDLPPVDDGVWAVEENAEGGPRLIPAQNAEITLFGPPDRYNTHWKTCPDAKDWHRRTRDQNIRDRRGPGNDPKDTAK
jgi:hypothetical protein